MRSRSRQALGLAAGTKPSKVADKFIPFTLLLVILVGTVASASSSMLPMTDAIVASVGSLLLRDVVVCFVVSPHRWYEQSFRLGFRARYSIADVNGKPELSEVLDDERRGFLGILSAQQHECCVINIVRQKEAEAKNVVLLIRTWILLLGWLSGIMATSDFLSLHIFLKVVGKPRHIELGGLPLLFDGLRDGVDEKHKEHRCQIVALLHSNGRGDHDLLPISFELHGDVGVELTGQPYLAMIFHNNSRSTVS